LREYSEILRPLNTHLSLTKTKNMCYFDTAKCRLSSLQYTPPYLRI